MRAVASIIRSIPILLALGAGTAGVVVAVAPTAALAKDGESGGGSDSGGSGGGGSGGGGGGGGGGSSGGGGGSGDDGGGRGRGGDDGGRSRGGDGSGRSGGDRGDRNEGASSGQGGLGAFFGSLLGGRNDKAAKTEPDDRRRGERDAGRGRESGRGDQDVARDAVARGQAVPFDRVIGTVRQAMPGDILDVKVGRSASGLTYNVTVLARDGWYREVVVDARRNRVLEVR